MSSLDSEILGQFQDGTFQLAVNNLNGSSNSIDLDNINEVNEDDTSFVTTIKSEVEFDLPPENKTVDDIKEIYSELVFRLGVILDKDIPRPEKAYHVGSQVMKYTSSNPQVDEDVFFDISTFENISDGDDVEMFVDFAEMYPRGNYPDRVHVETAVAVYREYEKPEEARMIMNDLSGKDGSYLSQVVGVWSEVSSVSLDEVSESVAQTGVENTKQAIKDVYSLSQKSPPSDTAIKTKLDDIDGEMVDGTIRVNENGQKRDGDVIVLQSGESEPGNSEGGGVDQQLPELPSFSDSNEAFEFLVDEYARLQNEYNENDFMWLFGRAVEHVKEVTEASYEDIYAIDKLDVSQGRVISARKLYEFFNFGEHPPYDDISPHAITNISRLANDRDATVTEIVNRATQSEKRVSNEARVMNSLGQIGEGGVEKVVKAFNDDAGVTLTKDSVKVAYRLDGSEVPPDEEIQKTIAKVTGTSPVEMIDESDDVGEYTTTELESMETSVDEEDTSHESTYAIIDVGSGEVIGEGYESQQAARNDIIHTQFDSESGENQYLNSIIDDTDIEFDPERGVFRTMGSAVKSKHTSEYGEAIPTDGVIEALGEFDEVVYFRTGVDYFKSILEENGVSVTDIDAKGTDTPYCVSDHTQSSLLLTHPNDENAIATLAVQTYAAKGGEVVLYFGEGPGSPDITTRFHEELHNEFEYVTSVNSLSWETNSDALHIYTRDGAVPDGVYLETYKTPKHFEVKPVGGDDE